MTGSRIRHRWNGIDARKAQAERRRVSNVRKMSEREDRVATWEELQTKRQVGEEGYKCSWDRLKTLNGELKKAEKDRKAAPRRTDLLECLNKLRKDQGAEQTIMESWEARQRSD